MNHPHNGTTAAATPAPLTHEDLLNVIIAKAAEFGLPADPATIESARQQIAQIPVGALEMVANVVRTAPREKLLEMFAEHGGPGPAPGGAGRIPPRRSRPRPRACPRSPSPAVRRRPRRRRPPPPHRPCPPPTRRSSPRRPRRSRS